MKPFDCILKFRHEPKQDCHDVHCGKQAGVGMVEVLVALVVLSVGLLGIAAMYVTTLQAKTTSGSRMRAVNIAYDIADRMRANPAGAASYVADSTGTTTQTTCTSTASTCTPQQIAASDLYLWDLMTKSKITGLPGTPAWIIAQATAPTSTSPAVYLITLTWQEATTGTLNLQYSLQVQI